MNAKNSKMVLNEFFQQHPEYGTFQVEHHQDSSNLFHTTLTFPPALSPNGEGNKVFYAAGRSKKIGMQRATDQAVHYLVQTGKMKESMLKGVVFEDSPQNSASLGSATAMQNATRAISISGPSPSIGHVAPNLPYSAGNKADPQIQYVGINTLPFQPQVPPMKIRWKGDFISSKVGISDVDDLDEDKLREVAKKALQENHILKSYLESMMERHQHCIQVLQDTAVVLPPNM